MKTIRLAPALTFPAAELATLVVSLLGNRGSGKSNAAFVLIEGLLTAEVPVIVLDYVGIYWSLRLDESGKKPSPFQIPVLGGTHGDITLMPTTGAVVADALARSHSSAVLDVSHMSKGDRGRFATDFAETFFRVKKNYPGPVQLWLEESQRFVPQKLFTGQERMLGAFEEIAEVGRNYGIGLGLISQRPQKINKDVLNLSDVMIALRMNGVLERKAIAEWVQEKDADGRDAVKDELPGLERGQAIVWSPSVFDTYGTFQLIKRSTYDVNATPLSVRKAVKIKSLNLAELESAMGSAVEEAKANDPRVLKARVAELEKALASKTAAAPTKPAREVEVLSPATLQRLERVLDKLVKGEDKFGTALVNLNKQRDRLAQAQQVIVSELGNVRAVIAKPYTSARAAAKVFSEGLVERPEFVDPGRGPRQAVTRPPTLNDHTAAVEHMPEKCQRMLGALHQGEVMGIPHMPFRNVAIIAGVSPASGTTRNRKAFLTAGGYITVRGDDVALTEKGRSYPLNVALPPTGRDELLDFWMREIGTEKIATMLRVVVQRGGATDTELAAAAGMEMSGTFRNYKAALTGRGLITKNGDTYVPAEVFFR